MRRVTIIVVLSAALVMLMAGMAFADPNGPVGLKAADPLTGPPEVGVTEGWYYLEFTGPTDTFTFRIDKAWGAGDLTVETLDYGPDDFWGVTLAGAQPRKSVASLGDGTSFAWSGMAMVHPWVRGEATVVYDHGVDVWPAGMWVKFAYSTGAGMHIAPLFVLPYQIGPFFTP
jgi:hypothetical protein